MKLHCIYCGATLEVSTITYVGASDDEKKLRWDFEGAHDSRFGGRCGPKALGMIAELDIAAVASGPRG